MHEKYPLVTIAIPTYNRADFVGKAVESALKQTHQNIEVLVIDNCSTDNTKDVISSIKEPRVRYVRNERNLGMTGNFNRSLEIFKGDYWVFLPDDDMLLPEYCESCLNLFKKYPDLGLVSSPNIACDPLGNELWRYPIRGPEYINVKQMWKRLVRMGHEISHPIISRRAIEVIGFFDDSFPWLADYDYWVRVSTRFPIGYVQGYYSVMTSHGEQASTLGWQSISNPNLVVCMKTVTKAIGAPNCPLTKIDKFHCLYREGNRFFLHAIKRLLIGNKTQATSTLRELSQYESLLWQAIYSFIFFPISVYKSIWLRIKKRAGKPFIHKYA